MKGLDREVKKRRGSSGNGGALGLTLPILFFFSFFFLKIGGQK